MPSQTGAVRFSDELHMRARSLHSLTLTKDFFIHYPEFRGEAPQLEPSLTLGPLAQYCDLELLYWNKLQELLLEKRKTAVRSLEV